MTFFKSPKGYSNAKFKNRWKTIEQDADFNFFGINISLYLCVFLSDEMVMSVYTLSDIYAENTSSFSTAPHYNIILYRNICYTGYNNKINKVHKKLTSNI